MCPIPDDFYDISSKNLTTAPWNSRVNPHFISILSMIMDHQLNEYDMIILQLFTNCFIGYNNVKLMDFIQPWNMISHDSNIYKISRLDRLDRILIIIGLISIAMKKPSGLKEGGL